MTELRVHAPDLGINGTLPVNLIDDRAAADGTQNIDFDNGILATPDGFVKLSGGSSIGEKILGLFQYTEVNEEKDFVVAAETQVYVHDRVNDEYDAITGAVLNADIFHPVSFASVLHQDGLGSPAKYQHLLICDGGKSSIKKWSGRGASATAMADGDGYNDTSTDHRALQVCVSQNRAILISPYEEAGGVWVQNLSRVRWPEQARLEDSAVSGSAWDTSHAGAGYSDLIDTGDTNVWAMLLGNTLLVYQTHSIWQLRYVGGTTVFTPDILIPDLGLLSWHLLTSTGSNHFFIGNDYNVYSYNGTLTNIGNSIADLLKRDLRDTHKDRCRMALGARHKYVWIFIVTGTNEYITKAYKYNLRNGSWTVRDFSHKYTGEGVTAAQLIGAGVYTIGQSYADAVTETTTYAAAVSAGTTYKDVLSEILVNEKLTIGDTEGYILQENEDVSTDDGTEGTHLYITKEFDGGLAEIKKRVGGISIDCKGEYINVEYRIDDGAWTRIYREKDNDTLGSELITNGGFDTDSDWIYTDDFSISGGELVYSANFGTSTAEQEIELTSGLKYVFGYEVAWSLENPLIVSSFLVGGTEESMSSPEGSYTTEIIAGSSDSKIVLKIVCTTEATSYVTDNLSLKEVYSSSLENNYKNFRFFINRTCKKIQFRMSGIYSIRSFTIFGVMPERER